MQKGCRILSCRPKSCQTYVIFMHYIILFPPVIVLPIVTFVSEKNFSIRGEKKSTHLLFFTNTIVFFSVLYAIVLHNVWYIHTSHFSFTLLTSVFSFCVLFHILSYCLLLVWHHFLPSAIVLHRTTFLTSILHFSFQCSHFMFNVLVLCSHSDRYSTSYCDSSIRKKT